MNEKAIIVPCSGIGKVHGLIGREAVYQAIDELCQEGATTLCLALLVTGDAETVDRIRSHPSITVDGCPKLCAFKNVEMAGGKVWRSIRVVDAFKGRKGAVPGSATNLSDDGWAITTEIANELVAEVKRCLSEDEEGNDE